MLHKEEKLKKLLLKNNSSSFVHQLKLSPELYQIHLIEKNFNQARFIYNFILSKSFKIRNNMIQNYKYKSLIQALKDNYNSSLSKKDKSLIKSQINQELNQLIKDFGFNEFNLHKELTKFRKVQYKSFNSIIAQKIASRAFFAVKDFHFKKRGKPRFKSFNQIKSLEGKNNDTGLRFKDGFLFFGKLKIKILFDKIDKYGVEEHALLSKVKFCRILKKQKKGINQYYLDLVLEGIPKIKSKHKTLWKKNSGKEVGLDLGPQSIAVVSSSKSFLEPFLPELDREIIKIKELRKKLSHKMRINNPNNYKENFKVKKDKKVIWKKGKMKSKKELDKWKHSKIYKELRDE